MVNEILNKTTPNIEDKVALEKIVADEKEKRAQQQELARAILNRYKELAAEEGLSSELNPHINEALKNIENAKTAKDVDNELSEFRSLLNADTYADLKTKFEDQAALLTAQEAALAELDAYESALDAIQDSDEKTAIEDALKLAREEIMAAETSSRIEQVITGFESLVETSYPTAKTSVAKKLITNALDEGVKQLEAYKTGSYAEEKLVDDANKTVKQLADEKIVALQGVADGLLQGSSVTTDSYKTVNETLKASVDAIDAEIEKIKDRMRENQDAYLEAYENALEELEIYEANAEKYGLTGDALEYIKSEVAAVKAKIASVDTEGEVNAAMSLFRNGIKQYSPAFDEYQVTETRKAVQKALEEYKELDDADITDLVNRAINDLKSAETVDEIKKVERNTVKAITDQIEENELLSAKLEARKEFLVFIDNDNYSEKVQAIASEAISKITDAYSVADVKTQVAKYKDLIDKQLKEEKTSMQAEIAKAREAALKEIAIYEEIATAAKDAGTLNRIAVAKAAITSEDATLKSIDTTKNNLIRDIKALGLPIVSAKVDAIDWLKGIGKNYYKGDDNAEVRTTLKAYTEGDTGSEELSYEKLIKDAYINSQFEKAFNMIKNAENEDAVNTQKDGGSEKHGGGTTTARGIIVKAIKQDLKRMETARAAAITSLGSMTADSKADPELKDIYTEEIKAVDMTKYMENPNIFDEILERAKKAVENHIKDLIKSEAQENLKVDDVNSKIKEKLGVRGDILGKPVDNMQKDVSIEPTGVEGEGRVKGQVKKVASFTSFSSDTTEQTGYYLTLAFSSDTAKTIKVTRTYGNRQAPREVILDDEGILTILLHEEENDKFSIKDTTLTIEFYEGEYADVDSIDEEPIQTIKINDFSGLNLVSSLS